VGVSKVGVSLFTVTCQSTIWNVEVVYICVNCYVMGDFGDFVPYAHFSTEAIHVGQEPEQWGSRAVVPPISLATTFKQDEPGKQIAVCTYLQYVARDRAICAIGRLRCAYC